MDEFCTDIRTLAADSKWNEQSLYDHFYQGLDDQIMDELDACDLPMGPDALMDLASQIDRRLRERRSERAHKTHTFYAQTPVSLSRDQDDGRDQEDPM